MNRRAAFVMVNHDGGGEVVASARSLLDRLPEDDLLILVDNGSSDKSAASVATLSPLVHVIAHPDNQPFAEATNIGVRFALAQGYSFIGPINPDVRVREGMVDELVGFLQLDSRHSVAAVSPVILYDDPRERIWFAGGRILYPIGWTQHLNRGAWLAVVRKSSRDVQFVTGCCWLSPAWAWNEIGLLDPSYGMYAEDVDWSTRARRQEKRLVVLPDAVLVHRVSMSSGGGRTALKMIYRTLAGRLFFKRWTPDRLRLAQHIFTPLFVAFYSVFLYLAEGRLPATAYLRAWLTKLKDPVPWPPSRHLTGNS